MSEGTQGEIRDILGQIRDYYLGLGILATDPLDIGSARVAGVALDVFADADDPTPGMTVANSKAIAIRWNNHATPTPVELTWRIPDDMDRTQPWFLTATAGKVGATLADATTLTVAAYLQAVGSLHDADADMGGESNALDGDAASKTVDELLFEFDPADLPASADASVSLFVGPTAGLLDTDDFLAYSLAVQYVRKAA